MAGQLWTAPGITGQHWAVLGGTTGQQWAAQSSTERSAARSRPFRPAALAVARPWGGARQNGGGGRGGGPGALRALGEGAADREGDELRHRRDRPHQAGAEGLPQRRAAGPGRQEHGDARGRHPALRRQFKENGHNNDAPAVPARSDSEERGAVIKPAGPAESLAEMKPS